MSDPHAPPEDDEQGDTGKHQHQQLKAKQAPAGPQMDAQDWRRTPYHLPPSTSVSSKSSCRGPRGALVVQDRAAAEG
eukprot:810372-Pelagomonas_calceolata.AAC.2